MKAFQNTVQMHHSNNVLTKQSKSDQSTKNSTLNEEKEPVPSFLKALNFYNTF